MELQTKVNIKLSETKIGYRDKILLLGSCFADNVGTKFQQHYFQTTINPFGTLYNPASIRTALQLSLQKNSKNYFLQHNGLWHSMMHHGSFSHPDKSELISRTEQSLHDLSNAFNEATTIILTFGTSWIYEMGGVVVANCHKMPADRFQRKSLSVSDIVDMWQPLLVNTSNKHWIFTVSPIRHIKDGLHANHLSKATLLQAIDILISNARIMNPSSVYSYFPSYEIMLDELRDYRFYAEDLVHPSSLAVDYIWQRFVDTYMSTSTTDEMRTLHQLWRDRNHRFLHPETEQAQKFNQRLEQRLEEVRKDYPWLG